MEVLASTEPKYLSLQNEGARTHLIPESDAVFAVTQPNFIRYQISANAHQNKTAMEVNSVVLPLISAKYL